MNRIREQWEDYRAKVVPKDASPNQILETKRGFYAGAWAAFATVMDISAQSTMVGDNETKQDAWAEKQMENLEAELKAFGKNPF